MRALLLLCLAIVFGCRTEPGEGQRGDEERVLTCEAVPAAPPPPTPALCRGDWCWIYPLPQQRVMNAIWATGPDSAWMVGSLGIIVHARGDALEPADTGTQATLNAVWGSSDQDVWAAGDGGILLHFDGARWQAVPSPVTERLTSLSGHSASDVWAAGELGTLLHWDGVAWSRAPLPVGGGVQDIASGGPGTVWVTHGPDLLRCTVLACETSSASVQVSGKSYWISELLSFSPDEVFALSNDLLRWQNGTWSSIYIGDYLRLGNKLHLAGTGPEDIWISACFPGVNGFPPYTLLTHYGSAPSGPWPLPETLAGRKAPVVQGLAAAAPGRPYVINTAGEVFRQADNEWRLLQVPTPLLRIAPGLNTPRRLAKGEGIADVTTLPNGEAGLITLGGRPPWTSIGLFSDSAASHWVAEASREFERDMYGGIVLTRKLTLKVTHERPGGTTVAYTSVRSFDGDPSPYRYANPIAGIHGSSEHNIWLVTASGVLRWNGLLWLEMMTVPSEEQTEFTGAVWTTSSNAAWIGLTQGLLFWNGKQFERVELPGFWVGGLWGSSSSDVWAVGARGSGPAAYHFDGSTWSEVQLPAEAAGIGGLTDVVGQCETDVYLVGMHALLHWDGARWTIIPASLGMGLARAAKVGGELWVVGYGSILARRRW